MVYTDGVHLVAESIQELLQYAGKVGLNSRWMQVMGKLIHPHFGICGKVKQRILADSSVQKVSSKEIIKICKLNFRSPETPEDINEWEQFHQRKLSDIELPSQDDFDRMFENILMRTGVHREK